jgi:hypothetical protein
MGFVVAFSEDTLNLISALLGAIVGGVASLAGSIVVSRWTRASDARLRLYEQLVPEAQRAQRRLRGHLDDEQLRNGLIHALRDIHRASVVAGKSERKTAHFIVKEWRWVSPVWKSLAVT